MIVQKNGMRNREICASYQQGESREELAKRHGLSKIVVDQTIRVERHTIAVSVDAFNEQVRSQQLSEQLRKQ